MFLPIQPWTDPTFEGCSLPATWTGPVGSSTRTSSRCAGSSASPKVKSKPCSAGSTRMKTDTSTITRSPPGFRRSHRLWTWPLLPLACPKTKAAPGKGLWAGWTRRLSFVKGKFTSGCPQAHLPRKEHSPRDQIQCVSLRHKQIPSTSTWDLYKYLTSSIFTLDQLNFTTSLT